MATPIVVNQSTTLVQVDTSIIQDHIVRLSSVNTPGSLITIRDITGNASTENPVTISTTQDVTFLDGGGDNKNLYRITQPYGFLTITPKTSTVWGVLNTFGFPDATAAANINNVTASSITVNNSYLNNTIISTALISTLSTDNVFVQQNLSVGQSTIAHAGFYTCTLRALHDMLTGGTLYAGSTVSSIFGNVTSTLTVPYISTQNIEIYGVLRSASTISTMGPIFAGSSISTTGNLAVGGSTFVQGELKVLKNVTFQSSLSTLYSLGVGREAMFFSSLSVKDDILTNGHLSTMSNTNVGGALSVMKSAFFTGQVSTQSNLTVGGALSVMSTFYTYGNAVLNSSLYVRASVSTLSNVYIASSLSVGGDLAVYGDIFFNDRLLDLTNLSVNQDLFVNNNISTYSSITAGQGLRIMGSTFLMGHVSTLSNVDVVGGISTMKGLAITGAGYFQSNVVIQSTLSTIGNMNVFGFVSTLSSATIGHNLQVARDLTVRSSLNVLGSTMLQSSVFITGNLSVFSSINVSCNLDVGNILSVKSMNSQNLQASTFGVSQQSNFTMSISSSTLHYGLFSSFGGMNLGGPVSTMNTLAVGSTINTQFITVRQNLSTIGDAAIGSNLFVLSSIRSGASTIVNGGFYANDQANFVNSVRMNSLLVNNTTDIVGVTNMNNYANITRTLTVKGGVTINNESGQQSQNLISNDTYMSSLKVSSIINYNFQSTFGQAAFFSSMQVQGHLSVFSTIVASCNAIVGALLTADSISTRMLQVSTLSLAQQSNFIFNVSSSTLHRGLFSTSGEIFSGRLISTTSSLAVGDHVNFYRNLTVGGDTVNVGKLNVTGLTTLVNSSNTGTLGVALTTTLIGRVGMGAAPNTSNALLVNGSQSNTGNTFIGGTLNVTDLATFVNSSNTGTLGVAGGTTLMGKVGMGAAPNTSNALLVSGTQSNTGNTFIGGTFQVTQATTLVNTLNLGGAATLSNGVQVAGTTTLSNALNVGQAATLSNTLNVTGQTTLGAVTITRNIVATGNPIAFGNRAATTGQGDGGVALGAIAAETNQGQNAVALGYAAAKTNQAANAISIGYTAGYNTQSTNSIAIGNTAGYEYQGSNAVAIGLGAGNSRQSTNAIAIGYNAGATNQGSNAIAIGTSAGQTNQATQSIVINASGSALNAATTGLFVNPIRPTAASSYLKYNTATSEISYVPDNNTTVGTLSRFILAADASGTIVSTTDYGATYLPELSAVLNNVRGMATNGKSIVAVGTDYYGGFPMFYKSNLPYWSRCSHLGNYFSEVNDILWDGKQFVAVGISIQNGATIADRNFFSTSPDGSLWTNRTLPSIPSTNAFNTAAAGKLVAFNGYYYMLYCGSYTDVSKIYKYDPVAATVVEIPTAFTLINKMFWTGSVWLIGGEGSYNLASYDGVNPVVQITLSPTDKVSCIASDGKRIVAAGGTSIFYSSGGSWTTLTNPLTGTSLAINDILWDGAKFVVFYNGGNKLATSVNGVTWSFASGTTNNIYRGLAFRYSAVQTQANNGLLATDSISTTGFVTIGDFLRVGQSTLVVQDSTRSLGVNCNSPSYPVDVNGVINAKFIYQDGAPYQPPPTTGAVTIINLTVSTLTAGTSASIVNTTVPTRILILGQTNPVTGSRLYTGTTPTNMTLYSTALTGTPTALNTAYYTGSLWYMGGKAASSALLYSSPDSVTWSLITPVGSFPNSEVNAIVYNGSYYLVCGLHTSVTAGIAESRSIVKSDNMTSFTASSSTSGSFAFKSGANAAAWNGNLWVAVGSDSTSGTVQNPTVTIKYSYDGITWTATTNSFSASSSSTGYTVVWNGMLFVAGGADTACTLKYSTDGIVWNNCTGSYGVNPTKVIVWSGKRFVAIQPVYGAGTNIFYSDNGIAWLNSAQSISYATSLIWTGSQFILGTSKSATAATMFVSTDGVTWTQQAPTTPYDTSIVMNSLAYSSNTVPDLKLANTNFFSKQPQFQGSSSNTNTIQSMSNALLINNLYSETSGRVGINNNNPKVALDVNGSINLTGDLKKNGTPFMPAGINVIPGPAYTQFAGAGGPGSEDGLGTAATFNSPHSIHAALDGYLYVCDQQNNKIRRIDSSGNVTTFAGTGTYGYVDGNRLTAQFRKPQDCVMDNSGNLYVADTENARIRKIDTAGNVTTFAGSGVASSTVTDGIGIAATFNVPSGMTIANDSLYVTEFTGNRIRRIVIATQAVTTLAGSTAGTSGTDDGTGTAARLNQPAQIAYGPDGFLYVATLYSIRKVSLAGVVTTFAGTTTNGYQDGVGTAAKFDRPYGIAFDILGNLFVSDTNNTKIRKITPAGVVTTFASGLFSFMTRITIDSSGNLYVVSYYDHRIFKFSYVTTVQTSLDVSGNINFTGDLKQNGAPVVFTPPGINSGGNIGINKASPAYPLDVNGDIRGNTFRPVGGNWCILDPNGDNRIGFSNYGGASGNGYLMYSAPSGHGHIWYTNGVQTMILDSAGSLTANRFSINSAQTTNLVGAPMAGMGEYNESLPAYNVAGRNPLKFGGFYGSVISSGDGGGIAFPYAMVISKGNVGINTKDPKACLEISGGVGSGQNSGAMAFSYAAGETVEGKGYVHTGGGYRHFISTRHNSADQGIYFYINNSVANTPDTSTAPGTGNSLALSITVGSIKADGKTTIRSPLTYSDSTIAPFAGKFQLELVESANGGQRLYLGSAYTGGAGAGSVIQSSDYYSSADHGTTLRLNPLGGDVSCGANFIATGNVTAASIKTSSISDPLAANARIQIVNGGGTYFNTTGTNQMAFAFLYAGAGDLSTDTAHRIVSIDSAGNFTASGNVTAYSDVRAKENIITIDSPLDKIMKMRGVYYTRKDNPSTQKQRQVGVIAQEVEEVLPEVVMTDDSEEKKKSVAYGNIVALLIEGMKEQQKQIEAQQSTINYLLDRCAI